MVITFIPMANNLSNYTSTNFCTPGIVMKSALIPGKLSVCCANGQSICARRLCKLDELRQIVNISNVDVVCVNESWLNDKVSDSVVEIKGYNSFRHDRVGRLGGGILVYCRKGLKVRIIHKSSHNPSAGNFEFLAMELTLLNTQNASHSSI